MAWERRRYRGNKVWILFGEGGRPTLDERGHAQLRYKPEDDRTYTVRWEEIRPLEGGPEAPPPPRTRPPIEAWVHVGSPDTDGRIGVGVLLRWRDRRRELTARLTPASDDELAVGAVLVALRAVKKPAWPVRVLADAGERLEAIRAGAGTEPEACGEALRQAAAAFADLAFRPVPTPVPADAERAARLAHDARGC